MDAIARHLSPISSRVVVPRSVPGLVTKRLLTMEFMEGLPLLQLADKITDMPQWKKDRVGEMHVWMPQWKRDRVGNSVSLEWVGCMLQQNDFIARIYFISLLQ